MSPLTIFLAKFLGLYCIIVALAMIAHKQSTVATIKALIRNPPLLLFAEVLGLAAGLAMCSDTIFSRAARCRSSSPCWGG
jgi:hypothetical protein